MWRRWTFLLALTLALGAVGLLPGSAAAQSGRLGFRGWGPHVGVTSGPDQVHLGVHFDFGDLARRVRFQPNIEVGVGDERTLAAVNFEAAYRFRSGWDRWSPYAGGGLGINRTGDDHGVVHRSSSELGAGVLGGIEKGLSSGNRMFLEAKLGLVDAPDLKLAIGWTFYQ